jgi:accessory gene regulator protein AgrB
MSMREFLKEYYIVLVTIFWLRAYFDSDGSNVVFWMGIALIVIWIFLFGITDKHNVIDIIKKRKEERKWRAREQK